MEYVLSETVDRTKVHLILGIKNTGIQPVLIKVLPPGVGVYLSAFKDVWGSRIIFAGQSKIFTQANREQQRESNLVVYSHNTREHLRNQLTTRIKERLGLTLNVRLKPFSNHPQLRMKYCRR